MLITSLSFPSTLTRAAIMTGLRIAEWSDEKEEEQLDSGI